MLSPIIVGATGKVTLEQVVTSLKMIRGCCVSLDRQTSIQVGLCRFFASAGNKGRVHPAFDVSTIKNKSLRFGLYALLENGCLPVQCQ